MPHHNWRKRLDIAKLPTVALRRAALIQAGLNNMEPTGDDEGFYRKPVTQRLPNGKTLITDYMAVALFLDNGQLSGVIGTREALPVDIIDCWTWICTHPITEELYRAVAERGEQWPDLEPLSQNGWGKYTEMVSEPVVPPERVITRDDNKPPELLPEVEAAEAIDNAIGAAKDLKVTNAQEAAIAAGAANIIRDRRLATEKIAKEKVDPLHAAYTKERDKWVPLVKRAKVAEDALRLTVTKYEADERRRIAKEQLEAMDRQRELDEANARAADRAIAAGIPEEPPVVEEVAIPQAFERIAPTHGSYRKPQVEKWHLDAVNDYDTLYGYFRNADAVKAVLITLATAAVRAGKDVPGVTRHWGII